MEGGIIMADKITLEFGPWEPDLALLAGQQAPRARNVIPAKRGWKSAPSPVRGRMPALSGRVLAMHAEKSLDGSMSTAAALEGGIFMLEGGAWVQRHEGTALTSGRAFASYGSELYALFGTQLLRQARQATAFAEVTAAPAAERLGVIRDFLVLGCLSGRENAIRWSGIDRPSEWPEPGTNAAQYVQSDIQVFPEGGKVQAIVGGIGGTDGLIFLERAIQRATYVGTPYIFQFDPVDRQHGTMAPRSPVACGQACYYLSEDGWKATDGAGVRPIGVERVDAWFFEEADTSRLEEVQGVHDARNRLAMWSFPSSAAAAGRHDRLLFYSYALDKWGMAAVETECLFSDYARGLTLEDLDEFGPLDSLDFSLDSPALRAGGRVPGCVNAQHRPCTFTGAPLEAEIDTAEQGGERMMLHGLRPLVDMRAGGSGAKAAALWRNRQMDPRSLTAFSAQMRDGVCYRHLSANYLAARVRIPAGASWEHAVGVEAIIEKEGGM